MANCSGKLALALDKARACAACAGTASYCTEVKVVTRVWDGGEIGLGSVSETSVTLVPRPKVVPTSVRYRFSEGGKFPEGDRKVEGVSLTYTEDDLADQSLAKGVERFYLLNGRPYRLCSEPQCAGTSWAFYVGRMRARPPALQSAVLVLGGEEVTTLDGASVTTLGA